MDRLKNFFKRNKNDHDHTDGHGSTATTNTSTVSKSVESVGSTSPGPDFLTDTPHPMPISNTDIYAVATAPVMSTTLSQTPQQSSVVLSTQQPSKSIPVVSHDVVVSSATTSSIPKVVAHSDGQVDDVFDDPFSSDAFPASIPQIYTKTSAANVSASSGFDDFMFDAPNQATTHARVPGDFTDQMLFDDPFGMDVFASPIPASVPPPNHASHPTVCWG